MPTPGESVKSEPEYQKLPADKRNYWENGNKGSLSPAQQAKICQEAESAAKYDRDTKKSGLDYPEKTGPNGVHETDHGAIVRNVKEYVSAKFPHRDVLGTPAPARTLGGLVDAATTPENPKNPPENPSTVGKPYGDPNLPLYVCHDLAEYMAAMMRCLGYPVREVNVKLEESNFLTGVTKSYQDAGIQVWFDGKWHFVNPFSCKYDPACSLDAYSPAGFNAWELFIWDGTTPPLNWNPVTNKGYPGGWLRHSKSESGNDLQKRFYSMVPAAKEALLYGFKSDGINLAHVYDFEHSEGKLSGVLLSSSTPHVQIYLTDEEGRICDGAHMQIPGAWRNAAGSVNPLIMGWSPGEEHFELPTIKQDSVFFGTRSLLAAYDEIKTHQLFLKIIARPGTIVNLDVNAISGYHPVTVSRIPPVVQIKTPSTTIPFKVTIDPVDPLFHLHFRSLLCCCESGCKDCCDCCCKYKKEQYIDLENWFIAANMRRQP